MAASPYVVTPAGGASQVSFTYGGSPGGPPCREVLLRGVVIDATAALETAIGTGNLISLTGAALLNEQIGEDASFTGNI